MTMKITLLTIGYCLLAMFAAGCSTTNLAKIIAAAAKDPAIVDFSANGYGVAIVYHRSNPLVTTNSGSVVITPTTALKVTPTQ